MTYLEDSTNLAVEKAKTRIHEIGQRLLVALAHEQLEEYDRFTDIKPKEIPDDLVIAIRAFNQEKGADLADYEANSETLPISEAEINAYLSSFHDLLQKNSERGKVLDIFADPSSRDMFKNAIKILETQQKGNWKKMASAMKALIDPTYSMTSLMHDLSPVGHKVTINPDEEKSLENWREAFLVDRLFNFVHQNGTISSRVTNYFPKAASLLVAHGLSGHDDYLLYHSSLLYGDDTLSQKVRQGIPQKADNDILPDLTAIVEQYNLPREYLYAFLLEFGDETFHKVVKSRISEIVTPSRVYGFLKRMTQHDGFSRGKIKNLE